MTTTNFTDFQTPILASWLNDVNTKTYSGNTQLSAAAVAGTAGTVILGSSVATTIGATGGASALPANPLGYLIAYVAGTQVKIPYYTA